MGRYDGQFVVIKTALPRGSPKRPARSSPPTPNSSESSSRCSWMALRPATKSSTPTPSPPPPPSSPSSSTARSPRQRYRPVQAGTRQPGRGRVPDPAASSVESDATGTAPKVVLVRHAVGPLRRRRFARDMPTALRRTRGRQVPLRHVPCPDRGLRRPISTGCAPAASKASRGDWTCGRPLGRWRRCPFVATTAAA